MAKAAVQQEAVRETEDLRVRDVLRAAAREDLMETAVLVEETVQERVREEEETTMTPCLLQN